MRNSIAAPFPFACKRAAAFVWFGFLSSGCLIELDEVKDPVVVDASGGTGGAPAQPTGGMAGQPGDGGAATGGETLNTSGGTGGGTGGSPESIYGPNLIANGDFSNGAVGWDNGGLNHLQPPPLMDGMGCTSDGGHTDPPDQFIGWSGDSGGVTLQPGTYRYQFTLRVIGSPDVEVKIASTVPPNYEPYLLRATIIPPRDSSDVYEYEFVVASEQTQMGLLFSAKNGEGTVCVDDVSLAKVL